MKTLIGVVAVTAMLFSGSVPVLAAEPSPDTIATTAADVFGGNDQIVTLDFPQLSRAFATAPQTAGFTDSLGLIDYYEFTTLYSLSGTDNIAVFTCPADGALTVTAAQAAAIANSGVKDHYTALSEGRYAVQFLTGLDIPYVPNMTQANCEEYAMDNYIGPEANGAVYIWALRIGQAGPGSTCALTYCGTTDPSDTWPSNGRVGWVTDSAPYMTMVWTHEHGHMLGWPHSSSGNGDSYDNPIDLMSGNSSAYGATYPQPYETTVANLLAAGWVPASDTYVYNGEDVVIDLVTTGTPGTQLAVIEIDSDSFWAIGARISDPNDPFPSSWNGVEVMRVDGCGASCYPLSRVQTPYGAVPWNGGDGKPMHMVSVGQSITVEGYTLDVISGDGDSFVIELSDPTAAAIPSYVERLSGADRYGTAAAVSASVFTNPSAVSKVFVATGGNFPDALAAAAAGGYVGGPVLLVGDTVPAATASELARLNPSVIYVVGGTSVVSSAVESALGSYGTVVRLSGADRYGTAAAVSASVFTNPSAVSKVFVATGGNFPDALAAAAAGGYVGGPVLLVGDTVPVSTAAELARLNPDVIYIVGGTAVVSSSVAAML